MISVIVIVFNCARAWPAGGLHELRDLHDMGGPYFDSLVMLAQAGGKLSCSQRAYATSYVIASLRVCVDNARPMALEALTLSGILLFIINWYHMIDVFVCYVLMCRIELKKETNGV